MLMLMFVLGPESYDRDLRYRRGLLSTTISAAQNWHDDIVAPRYRDLKLHTSSCHSSSEPRHEIDNQGCVQSRQHALRLTSQYARPGVGYMVGRAVGCVGKGWAVPCPPPPRWSPLSQRVAGGGIALQYSRWTEEAWELCRATASRPWLKAYLQSTPVWEKSALSWPAAVVTCVHCHVPSTVASCSPHHVNPGH